MQIFANFVNERILHPVIYSVTLKHNLYLCCSVCFKSTGYQFYDNRFEKNHIFFICIVLFSAVLYTFVLVVACEPVPQQTESTSLTSSSQLSQFYDNRFEKN
jgi:hypothetical protein